MATSNIIIEVIVRSIATVLSGGTLIAAAVSLDKLLVINNNDLSDITITIIDGLSSDVRQITAAAVALAITSAVLIPVEILMIVLRLFSFKLGIFSKILVIMDLVVIILSMLGFGLAGILSSVAAKKWSDDVLDRVPGVLPFADLLTGNIVDLRNGTVATAACSFFASGACVILLFFVIALMMKSKKLYYMGK